MSAAIARAGLALMVVCGLVAAPVLAQDAGSSSSPSSSSSSSPRGVSSSVPDSNVRDESDTVGLPAARMAQPDASGSAVTLETSEPLFFIGASLNACGYDDGLSESAPVRQKIRDEMNEELAASATARDARDALCRFVRGHELTDPGQSLAQYVSLALFVKQPPDLSPSVDVSELPPDSTRVMDVLPLVRAFAEQVHLNALWAEHKMEYDSYIDRIHDPLTKMVLGTNIYLHLPVSGYEGRRFVVLLEPMLSPEDANARYNGTDSVIVVSPKMEAKAAANGTNGAKADAQLSVPMDRIRHTYLHFLIEPLVYANARSMDRLLPLLRPVQSAPLEFTYKSDIVALLDECLIKAVEIHTMDVGIAKPERPAAMRDRSDDGRYQEALTQYEREAEAVRRKQVDLAMRQGWVLVQYFYDNLAAMEHDSISLRDNIGPMVYGMDVDRVRHQAEQIVFLPTGSGGDMVKRVPRPLQGLDLAEMKLMKGDLDGAEEMADAALKTNPANAQAHFILGRVDLAEGDPEEAVEHLNKTVELSHDPRTLAWAHIYLGRLYDIARDPQNPDAAHPERAKALAEYKAALAARDSQPDTKAAAEKGLAQPFALPPRPANDTPDAPLDPTGKAEKESWRPGAEQPSQLAPQQQGQPAQQQGK